MRWYTFEIFYAGAKERFLHLSELFHFIPAFSSAYHRTYRNVYDTFQTVYLQMVPSWILQSFHIRNKIHISSIFCVIYYTNIVNIIDIYKYITIYLSTNKVNYI